MFCSDNDKAESFILHFFVANILISINDFARSIAFWINIRDQPVVSAPLMISFNIIDNIVLAQFSNNMHVIY